MLRDVIVELLERPQLNGIFTGQVMKKSLVMIWGLESLIVLALIKLYNKGSSDLLKFKLAQDLKV